MYILGISAWFLRSNGFLHRDKNTTIVIPRIINVLRMIVLRDSQIIPFFVLTPGHSVVIGAIHQHGDGASASPHTHEPPHDEGQDDCGSLQQAHLSGTRVACLELF